MYQETPKARKFRLMREAKERKRMDRGAREEFKPLPDLRREIIVVDHDNDEVHNFRMYKTGRIDQYRVIVDGNLWRDKIGFSAVLEGIRKAMPPIRTYVPLIIFFADHDIQLSANCGEII